jgi:hypothetical protein
MKLPVRREKAEQAAGVQLLRSACGAHVYVLGHPRPAGDRPSTMQTPGLPDVIAFLPVPRTWTVDVPIVLVMWEAKSSRGRLRPEQTTFLELCQAAEVRHVVGDLDALIAWLIEYGFLQRGQVPHYRLPAEPAAVQP